MWGAIALVAVLISGQLCFADATVCDKLFDYETKEEYLPFPLIGDELGATSEFEINRLYIPEADVTLEFFHLMGSEYLIQMTDNWSEDVGRGVAVLSGEMVNGFIEHGGEFLSLDIAAIKEGNLRQFYARIDGRCFKAETESKLLP